MEIYVAVLLVAILVTVGVYDVAAIFSGGELGTVSEVVLAWSQRWPVIPLAAGIVIGHLFFPLTVRLPPACPPIPGPATHTRPASASANGMPYGSLEPSPVDPE